MTSPLALVYPYFLTSGPKHQLFQPLGIASLASQARALGVGVSQVDCTFRTFDDVVAQLAAERPSIVGIYVMVTLSRNALRLQASLRERLPDALFVAGGPLPTLYPERFAAAFDVVFRGESDLTFPTLCRDLLTAPQDRPWWDRLDLARYPGLHARTPRGLIANLPIHQPQWVLDTLPIPEREGVDHARYQASWANAGGAKPATIMFTRGCPFACDFCSKPVFGDQVRRRSLDHAFTEVADIARRGYNQLWIADDCFTLDQTYLSEFCFRFAKEGHGLTWTCLSRVNGVTPAVARMMRAAGCVKVYLGLESGCDSTLALMNKRATVREATEAVTTLHQAGIRVGAFFIVGYPGETAASADLTFEYALSLPFAEISFNVPFPLPGSALHARLPGVSAEADWDVENETTFVFPSEFDAAWLKRRIAETLEAFDRRSGQAATAPGPSPDPGIGGGRVERHHVIKVSPNEVGG
jgi:anaerobic magnesium-protoporphyrin IX monomethyl ester cyclase